MDPDRIHRRKQFSSCDACRKSRVACDAMRRRPSASIASAASTCTRCAARNRSCTFEWMNKASLSSNTNRTLSAHRRDHQPSTPSSAVLANSSLDAESRSPALGSFFESADEHVSDDGWHAASSSTPCTPAQSLNSDVTDWLVTMYEDGFEAVFGSWLGNYGCPFVFGEHGHLEKRTREQRPLSLSFGISSLCRQFDQWMKELEARNDTARDPVSAQAEMEKERQIDRTLNQAIQTYSARWLPLAFQSSAQKEAQNTLIQNLWRDLQKSLLKSINRPCYRSVWSLYLFAMVPIPVGIPEEEEDNGIPALLCIQAALQQVQHLRARQRCFEFNGSKVSPRQNGTLFLSNSDQMKTDFMNIESIIYWAALTFDTSSSLTFNTKSLLSSGLLGWESEPSWRLVKSCSDIFHEQTKDWRVHGVMVNEENANQIIAAAAALKLRVWKVVAVLKEALREGHEEEAVQSAYMSAVDAMKQFNLTYRTLLVDCERRIQFLSQHTKLRWYELMLHYHLCILIMIDAVEIARRTDILEQLSMAKVEAEGIVMNCLVFGLTNKFTIPSLEGESFVSVPLVAIDPYPHHAVAAVQLLWKGIERDYDTGKLDQGSFENLLSILLQTLELLPQSSKSVRNVKEQLQLSSQHVAS